MDLLLSQVIALPLDHNKALNGVENGSVK